ncbi:MAG TPA: TrkA family potassium uptake protein [Draconibacterium sp.]|nr:TrkA family potassium uptake protein [Draconibacterium sp.]
MNVVAIGLGNFGASLAKILTAMGHDVLGVDKNSEKVEFFKDKIANTICLDASDPHALRLLPIMEADVFVVCIGDDFGVSVMISALLKKFGVRKVICRESSSIHLTVLNSIGISYTINPEFESAQILAQKLALSGIDHLFNISETLKIVDLPVPAFLIGQNFSPSSFKEKTHLKIVALRRNQIVLYTSSQPKEDRDIEDFVYQPDDILVLVGDIKYIRKFLNS